MERQLFIYKNIALHFYYSKESVVNGQINAKNVFIYFPGLPQMIDEDFFTNKVDKNIAFFSVYYSGSWLSGGSFTYENCKKTIELAVEFVKHRKGIKAFDNKQISWKYENLHIMGYSFSGNPVVSVKLSKTEIKNVILFAPLLFLHQKDVTKYLKDKKVVKNFYDFSLFYLEFLRRGYKFAFRGIENHSWDKYFTGKDPQSFVKMDKGYPQITIFHGKSDKKITYLSSIFFQKVKCPQTKVVLIDKAGHNLKELFNMNKIKELISL